MLSIPLPFLVALLLAILFIRMARSGAAGGSHNPLLLLVGAYALQAAIVGLRWSFDLAAIQFVQPILASALPGIAWLAFSGLGCGRDARPRALWLHALPVVIIAILTFVWRLPIDPVLAVLFIAYGTHLLWVFRQGPDSLGAIRIGDEITTYRAILLVGGMLIGSGLIDLAVGADFRFNHGVHSARMVAIANVIILAAVGYAAAIAENSRPAADADPADQTDEPAQGGVDDDPSSGAEDNDAAVLAVFESAMRERRMYVDPNLTLDRLARRIGIPARQISGAVNRAHGRNVSQIVNEYRVAEAKQRLAQSDATITEILFASGFQTKSNFNREFKRVTGMTPSDYRRTGVKHLATDQVI